MSKFSSWAKKTGFQPRIKSSRAAPPPPPAQAQQAPAQGAVTLYTADGQPVTFPAVNPAPVAPGQHQLVATQRPTQMVHPHQRLPRSSTRHAPECMLVKPDEHTGYNNLLHQLPDLVQSGACPNLNPDGVDMLTAFGTPEKAVMNKWTPGARAYNGATERAPNVDQQMSARHRENRAHARAGGSHAVTATARGETNRKIQ